MQNFDSSPTVAQYASSLSLNLTADSTSKPTSGKIPATWWLKFPGQGETVQKQSFRTYVHRIKSHKMLGIGFEARQHNGTLYVRRDPDFINP